MCIVVSIVLFLLRLDTSTDVIYTAEYFFSSLEFINAGECTLLVTLDWLLRTSSSNLVANRFIKFVPAIAAISSALEQNFKRHVFLDFKTAVMTV